jgi:copper chaperone CopZ
MMIAPARLLSGPRSGVREKEIMEERETVLMVTRMTCGSCARRVETALLRVEGVSEVSVQVREGTALVRHAPHTSREQLSDALAAAGYPVGERPLGEGSTG